MKYRPPKIQVNMKRIDNSKFYIRVVHPDGRIEETTQTMIVGDDVNISVDINMELDDNYIIMNNVKYVRVS